MRLRRLEPVLRRALRGPCRLPAGATVLLAVSGGADSTALLVAMASLAREFALSIRAAHLHHGLRGAEADADLVHVRELCERLKTPLEAARWDCAARMRRRGLSGEAGLRTLRREYLLTAARRAGAVAIATAHTADDQLETLLMRLARGTGLTGMAGMRARQGAWIKPMLDATRADIERDLRQHGLSWCEDESNATPAYTRNRIRHGAVPALLDALGVPSGAAAARRERLARRAAALAAELADAGRALSRVAAARLSRSLVETPEGPALDARALAKLSPSLLRLVLARAWGRFGPTGAEAEGLTARHVRSLGQCLAGGRARAEVALPRGWRGRIERWRLRFVPPAAGARARGTTPRRSGRADARLVIRYGRARSRAVSGRSAPRRRRRTTPHDRTPA
jgi:tRNA(Ile)-lysidine synthase